MPARPAGSIMSVSNTGGHGRGGTGGRIIGDVINHGRHERWGKPVRAWGKAPAAAGSSQQQREKQQQKQQQQWGSLQPRPPLPRSLSLLVRRRLRACPVL